jgi:hypothetical protein
VSAFELDWYACDLKTGAVVEELPAITTSNALERRLSASSTVNADLTIAGAPPAWPYATMPGRSLLAAADRLTGQLLWAGIVLTRSRGVAATVSLGLATPEAYLDRRYTGTYTAAGVDQAAIMAGVAGAVLVDGPPITIDAPAVGLTGVYSVGDGDDRTVASALQELQQQDGWPEWTVDVQWANAARDAVALVLRIRKQIGVVRDDPDPVFDLPGCITDYTQTESYEVGKGATHVLAYGTGEGSSRLHSDLYVATDLLAQSWPRWDYRWTPAAGGTDPTALNAQAAQALSQMRTGSSAWAVTAAASAAPRIGRDWALGDSIGIHIDADTAPGHPDGADFVARAYAWQLDPNANTITPILVEDD